MKFQYENVEVRNGGDLPHWNVRGGLYFVTFCLADSIPLRLLNPMRRRREKLIFKAMQESNVEQRIQLIEEAKREYHATSEKILDTNLGSCLLAQPAAAEIVVNALRHFDGDRYDLLNWSIMPNHVHNVFRLGDIDIDRVLQSWKSFTSNKLNKLMGWSGRRWQREYFDVTIRDRDHLDACLQYVLNNPLKADTNPNWTGFSLEAFQRCGL